MSWVAVAIGGSAVVGAVVSSNSANRAATAQSDAANASNATQRSMYDQTRADQEPWRQAGERALTGLEDQDFKRDFTADDFQADPGYQFRLEQGQKALEASASSRGGRHGTGAQQAVLNYGQGMASQEYQSAYDRFNADRDRRFGRLASVAGVGQAANAQVGAAGQNYANQFSQNTQGAANAQGAAYINQGNQINGAIGTGLTAGALYGSKSGGGAGGTAGGGANVNYNITPGNYNYGNFQYSDARLKTNITPVSKEDMAELKKNLKAYSFDYVSSEYGEGNFVGVMAQDLEKSKLGKTLVTEDSQGRKQVNTAKVMMLFLATMAEG